MSKKLTEPTDKAAPDLPDLDAIKSIPVGIIRFAGTQDGVGMIQKSSLTSKDQRNSSGRLPNNSQHTMVFIPSLNSFRIKCFKEGKVIPFQISATNVAYWQALNE